jgi:hypothetical protein
VQTKKVNIGEVAGDCRRDVVLVYLLKDELDVGLGVAGVAFLTRAMKRSIESELTPAPLFRLVGNFILGLGRENILFTWTFLSVPSLGVSFFPSLTQEGERIECHEFQRIS